MLRPRRRTPADLLAAAVRYAEQLYRGQRDVYRYARLLERNFTRPLEDLEAQQDRDIAAIVNHAYANSPFYRRRFDACGFKPGDVRGRADLAGLPEISKSEIAANIHDVLCLPKEKLLMSSTGGTSGIALNFYRDMRCLLFRRGIDLATARYYGWRGGQWQGWLWGAPRDVLEPVTLKAKLLRKYSERTFYFDALNLSTESYRRFAALCRRYRPAYVSAYPSLAYDLALRIESGEVEPFRIPLINFTAEPVYDFQRLKVCEMFADRVFERYGSREFGMAALECPAHAGLHYFTESVYFETVRRDLAAPGNSLIVTDLLNYGMPLIRYQVADFADIESGLCSCGRTSPRLTNIRGRELDIIWTPEGHGIAGVMLVFLIIHLEIPARIQISQEALDRIVIRVEGNPGSCDVQLSKVIDIYRNSVSATIRYDIEYVDRIERTPAGKYRYVASKVNRPV